MEVMEAIYGRRSVRSYAEGGQVSEEQVKELLKAAMAAPSAHNGQPWHFVVLDERGAIDKVADILEFAQMARKAPLAILVCGDSTVPTHGFWVQDCAAAIQNMLIAAVGMDLGAVWTGIYPGQEYIAKFQQAFDIPKEIIPLGCVIVGRPKNPPKSGTRYKSCRIHRNGWQASDLAKCA
ncbi:nitroreductase [Alphaproteobacteria bacterium]|nr:nitroreductase [Alphaproteobacteria bacterium]